MLARRPAILDKFAQLRAAAWTGVSFCKFLARHTSTFDALRKFYFLFGGQKWDAADFLQIQTDCVVGIYVCQVVVQPQIGLRFNFSLFNGNQFIFSWFGGGGVLHK